MPETPISSELNLSQVANTLERASNLCKFLRKVLPSQKILLSDTMFILARTGHKLSREGFTDDLREAMRLAPMST